MKKLGKTFIVLLIIGCMGIITVENYLISLRVKAASHLIADTVVLGMNNCHANVYGRATGDSYFAEVIQQLDSTVTPESNYSLMNEELHKRLYDVYGTMLKWSVDVGYGMYANYALVDFDADAKWDYALKAVTESPAQDVFFYCLSEDANPTDRSIASIVGVVTIDGVDIFLASKAEFDYTRIYSTDDARHLIKASLDAVLVDKAEQCSAFFCLF